MEMPRAVTIALGLVTLLLVSMGLYGTLRVWQQPAEVAPSPTATAAPVPTASPYAAPEIPTQATHFVSRRFGYALTLPAGWILMDELSSANGGELLRAAQATLQPKNSAPPVELLAYDARTVQQEMPTALTVAAAPTNGLSLDGYLAAVQEELQAVAAQVERTKDHTVRKDALPAGVLQATLPGAIYGISAEVATTQIVLIDGAGQKFLIVTLATMGRQAESAQEHLKQIMDSLELH